MHRDTSQRSGDTTGRIKMSVMAFVTLILACSVVAGETQFGYAPNEPITSVQDLVQHAQDEITEWVERIKRLEANGENVANGILQAMKIQSSDPEGLLALVTEDKMAIANIKPAGVDVTSCEDGNDVKYQAMVQGAGPGIQACLQNISATLQPYYQTLRKMIEILDAHSKDGLNNVTNCAKTNKNQGNVATCLQAVGQRVHDGRDKLVAAMMGEIADLKNSVSQLTADLTVCTNAVQDKAIGQSVDIIRASRECIRAKVKSTSA